MREVIVGFVLIFGAVGATFAYLGTGENRHRLVLCFFLALLWHHLRLKFWHLTMPEFI